MNDDDDDEKKSNTKNLFVRIAFLFTFTVSNYLVREEGMESSFCPGVLLENIIALEGCF